VRHLKVAELQVILVTFTVLVTCYIFRNIILQQVYVSFSVCRNILYFVCVRHVLYWILLNLMIVKRQYDKRI